MTETVATDNCLLAAENFTAGNHLDLRCLLLSMYGKES